MKVEPLSGAFLSCGGRCPFVGAKQDSQQKWQVGGAGAGAGYACLII